MMRISFLKRPSRRKRQKSTLLGSCIALLIVFLLYHNHGFLSQGTASSEGHTLTAFTDPLLKEQAQFWRSLYHVILNNDPHCRKRPDIVVPTKLDISFEDDHLHARPDILWVDDADLQRMKIAHQNFLDDVQTSQLRLVYRKGTRGITTTVSESQIPVLLIQLRMLRASGSVLPIEVFFSKPTSSINQVCTDILPDLGATCLYYSEVFSAAGTTVTITSYQNKIFAILFSTFDEVLLLDCDSWPISNPDHLFTYPPFTDSGLILWPDFWYASESPYFFTIAKIEHPLPLHVKPSTESGQMMYAKHKHEASVMLAAYYNYYGPEYYYSLQSQGAPGQGDKETFGSAALAMKEDFYWVGTLVTAMGRMDSSHHFVGSAMVQYDPIIDFQNRQVTPQSVITNAEEDKSQTPSHKNPRIQTGKPMFIHANFPKFDPRTIFNEHDIGPNVKASTTRDSNGTYVRCWDMTDTTATDRFGYDVERRFWEVIKAVACDDLTGRGDTAQKQQEMEHCRRVQTYVLTVFGEHET